MRYFAVILLTTILFASCKKKPAVPECGDPPGPENLERYGFVVRDSLYRNMLLSGPGAFNASSIKISQLCTQRKAVISQQQGILYFDVWLGASATDQCTMVLLHWDENNTDTFTLNQLAEVNKCYTRYYPDSASFRVNDQKLLRDTISDKTYGHLYTIRR